MSVKDELAEAKGDQERARAIGDLARQQRTARELRALIRSQAEEIDDLDRKLAIKLNADARSPIKIARAKKQAGQPMTPICLWSDWHVEEPVRLEQTAGRNEFSPDIAKVRFERLINTTAKMIRREMRFASVGEIVIATMGDFMSGNIHPDLAETGMTPPIETAGIVHALLLDGLKFVADETKIERVLVPTCYGNHGRINQGRPRISTGSKHNLEQWVYQLVARDLADDSRFRFDVGDTAFKYLELGDFRVRFHHGDAFGYGGGVGGISVPYYRAMARWEQETHADLTCIGHWHQQRDFQNGVVNGSLIGTSEYSRLHGFEHPQQMVLWIDRARDRKEAVHPVFLD